MIKPDVRVSVEWLPLDRLVVTEHQPRYIERLLHYLERMTLEQNIDCAPGVISVEPRDNGTYAILDGHHRYCAHVMLGRERALCLIVDERRCRA